MGVRRREANMKLLTVLAVVIGSLAFGASSLSAANYSAGIYRSDSTCSQGATSTFGAKYGTFKVSTTHGSQVVNASVSIFQMHPYTNYDISIVESGYSCVVTQDVASIFTDGNGAGVVHFAFWQHTGENHGWAWIQHDNSHDIVKSTAVPIKG
jgi:hypothetical protein